jgi:hypothetical protein
MFWGLGFPPLGGAVFLFLDLHGSLLSTYFTEFHVLPLILLFSLPFCWSKVFPGFGSLLPMQPHSCNARVAFLTGADINGTLSAGHDRRILEESLLEAKEKDVICF